MKKSVILLLILGSSVISWNCHKEKPVEPDPEYAYFTATPESGTAPLLVKFEAKGTAGAPFEWYFGDGASSSIDNPSHQYLWPGVYAPLMIANKSAYLRTAVIRTVRVNGLLFENSGWTPGMALTSAAVHNGVSKSYYEDYDNPFSTKQYEVRSDFNRFYLIGGYTQSGDPNLRGPFYALLDPDGRINWQKNQSAGQDACLSAVAFMGNRVLVSGYQRNAVTGIFSSYLTCLDTNGVFIWNKTFSNASGLIINKMYVGHSPALYYPEDNYSNIMLTGYVIQPDGNKDVLAISVTKDGETVWQKSFGTQEDEEGLDVTYSFYSRKIGLTGYSKTPAGDKNVLIATLNPESGEVENSGTFGSNGDEEGRSIIFGGSQTYLVAGNTDSYGAGGKDMLVMEANVGGTVVNYKTVGTSGDETAVSVSPWFETSGSSTSLYYLLIGNKYSGNNEAAPWLVKISTFNLVKLSEKEFPANQGKQINAAATTVDDGLFMVGENQGGPYMTRTNGK